MTTTVCTGAWGPNAEDYARRFMRDLVPQWKGVRFVIFIDRPMIGMAHPPSNVEVRSMFDLNGWQAFMDEWSKEPAMNGCRPKGDWKRKDIQAGYNFRYDAVKFAGQGFIPEAVAQSMMDGEILVWLDADVIAHRDVPANLADHLMDGAPGAYLGRKPRHSEIGFWCIRLGPMTRLITTVFANFYRHNEFIPHKEWHSAYLWDRAREYAEVRFVRTTPPLRDLTPGQDGHVFVASPLGQYMDHLKGKRKGLARSPEAKRYA